MNLTSGSGYLNIEEERNEYIFDNRSIVLWTNGYEESLHLTVEELDTLIEELVEFRRSVK